MPHLALTTVKMVAAAVERRADEIGKPFAITVVDAGGHKLLVYRLDGVQAAASEVSAAKARAAALFHRASGGTPGEGQSLAQAELSVISELPLEDPR